MEGYHLLGDDQKSITSTVVLISSGDEEKKNWHSFLSGDSLRLITASIGLLVTGCGNAVCFKKMTNALPNYGWFLSQVTCIVYVPIFGVVVAAAMLNNSITKEMRNFPKYRFAVMGFFDGSSSLMAILGGAFTTGPAQLVLSQAVIPVTLIFSTLILGHHFHLMQYIGSGVIILGVVAAKWALLFPGVRFLRDETRDIPLFNLIYAASAIPGALSQIYKEHAFTSADLDVNYMQFWVAVFQGFIGIFIAPFNALPILGPQCVPLREMPRLLKDGFLCLFLGINSITKDCNGPDQVVCDNCSGAWVPVVLYILFNVLFNVFSLLVIKSGGAALSFVISALRLPLTTLCFYSTVVMGQDRIPPSIFDFLGLSILIVGLGCYRYGAAATLALLDVKDTSDLESNFVIHTKQPASMEWSQDDEVSGDDDEDYFDTGGIMGTQKKAILAFDEETCSTSAISEGRRRATSSFCSSLNRLTEQSYGSLQHTNSLSSWEDQN